MDLRSALNRAQFPLLLQVRLRGDRWRQRRCDRRGQIIGGTAIFRVAAGSRTGRAYRHSDTFVLLQFHRQRYRLAVHHRKRGRGLLEQGAQEMLLAQGKGTRNDETVRR